MKVMRGREKYPLVRSSPDPAAAGEMTDRKIWGPKRSSEARMKVLGPRDEYISWKGAIRLLLVPFARRASSKNLDLSFNAAALATAFPLHFLFLGGTRLCPFAEPARVAA